MENFTVEEIEVIIKYYNLTKQYLEEDMDIGRHICLSLNKMQYVNKLRRSDFILAYDYLHHNKPTKKLHIEFYNEKAFTPIHGAWFIRYKIDTGNGSLELSSIRECQLLRIQFLSKLIAQLEEELNHKK